ncbi:MAG: sugar phosphate isomerase/epimerase [Opitutaceae bacterium]
MKSTPPVSLQLWSVRDSMNKDFAAMAKDVAAIGYRYVETAGYGNLNAEGAKAALDAAGLKVSGMHVGIQKLREELSTVVAEARLFGAMHVTCPGWPKEDFATAAGCAKVGEELNGIGARLRAEGLPFSFHNHGAEFAVVEGRYVFDWMLDAAEPRNLGCQLDIYWAFRPGADPVRFIREHGRRITQLHFKDGTRERQSELGTGEIDFKTIIEVSEAIGACDFYIVEQEEYNFTPMESVRICFEQMKAWGRA